MRRSKPSSLILVLCAGLFSTLLACGDNFESFYPTLTDADKAGAIARGWIPDYLPESSRDIHEVHHNSPSTQWCAFEFLPADSQRLRKNLRTIDVLPGSVARVPSPGVDWWPGVLTGKLDSRKVQAEGFHLYVIEEPTTAVSTQITLFAIDWQKGRVFFYGTPESSSGSSLLLLPSQAALLS
jgi:hypothetical protein